MEFIPYDKESNTSDGMSLSDLTRTVLMSMYQEKKTDASGFLKNLFRPKG